MLITEKAKHTPGPWIEIEGWIVQQANPSLVVADPRTLDPQDADCLAAMEANSCLIAASPELLEALEYVQETIKIARKYFPKSMRNSDTFQLENTCATVGSAIRKAKEGL